MVNIYQNAEGRFSPRHFPYVVIGVLCLVIFLIPLSNADELWNYTFAKEIAEGFVPYKDISMIPTPLAAYIAAVFLKVFGEGLFVYRVVGYILMVITFSILYRMCVQILEKSSYALMVTLTMFVVNYFSYIYSYNTLLLCLLLVILMLELKDKTWDGDWKTNLLVGVISGYFPLIKQSIGIVLLFVGAIVCLYHIKKNLKRKRVYVVRMGISIVPCIMFLCYLIYTDSFWDFWDYAIVGIGYFSHRITFMEFMLSSVIQFIMGLFLIAVLFYLAYCFLLKRQRDKIQCVFGLYAISWLLTVSYPLCDLQHLLLGIVPLAPLFFLYIKQNKVLQDILLKVNVAVVTFVIVISAIVFSSWNNYVYSSLPNYEGILMSKSLEESIITVCSYIEDIEACGSNVYIANEYACIYRIPLDEYEKNWDLLLVGNIGSTTIEEMLDVPQNSIFLVLKDKYMLNRQAHFELIDYIKQNYDRIDEVLSYDVYQKK